MKLQPFEKLLINVEGFLVQPQLVKCGDTWEYGHGAWVYRANVVIAVGVRPITLRVLKKTGADRAPTCPRFVGHYIVESKDFVINDETNTLVARYHREAEQIAPYIIEHKLYTQIHNPPAFFSLTDSRFADILKLQESRQ